MMDLPNIRQHIYIPAVEYLKKIYTDVKSGDIRASSTCGL